MTKRMPVAARVLCLMFLPAGMLTGCAATTAGTAIPAAAPPALTAETLPGLLLPAGQVGSALSDSDVAVTREVSSPWDDSAHIDEGVGCLAVAGAAQKDVYAAAGWSAMHGQVLREPPTAPSWSHFATQAVVLFDSAQAARDFFAQSPQIWAACANRDITYAQQLAPEQRWSIGPVALDGEMLAVSREQRSPQRWFCQRALTVHGQVAVDVEACTQDGPTAAAATIARSITDRMGPA